MNWFANSLPWYGWLALSLIPPLIVLLYFLKLRRVPVEVPSTYLWTRTIEDLHVNSIWQRLRNSLLLLLQLLLAFLLILACLQPGCQGTDLEGERFVFLVDQSASMSATDGANGASRLEVAKSEIRNMIDAMSDEATAMIISFSNESDVVQSYTNNKSLLKRKLASIEPTQRPTDITEALTAASGLANPGRTSDRKSEIDVQVADALAAKMLIFSDGGMDHVPEFSLGNLQAEYRPVGAADVPHNVGITGFSISSDVDVESGIQAFVRLQNSDDEPHRVSVSLLADGAIFDAKDGVEVPPEKATLLSFDLTPLLTELEKPVAVEVQIDDRDLFMLDNRVFGTVEPSRKAKILVCTPSNNFLKLALDTERVRKLAAVRFESPAYLQSDEYAKSDLLGEYDLIVFDRCTPQKLPDSNTLFVAAMPPGDSWSWGAKQFPTVVVDSLMSHPLMSQVQMNNVTIAEGGVVTGPAGTVSLLDATYGSIMAIAPRGGFQDLVIGFALLEENEKQETVINSDWPSRLSFPLFVQNTVSWLAGAEKFSSSKASQPGELVIFRTRVLAQNATVTAPDGRKTRLTPREDNSFVFADADDVGIYRVATQANSVADQLLAINLLDPRESNLAVRDELNLGYDKIVGTRENKIPARLEYWPWVIATAIAVLLLEWYIYNQRVLI